jgi:acetoin utilization deacetylase AcuC-like enzyme
MKTGFFLHPESALHDTGWNHPEHQGRLRYLASTVGKDLLVLHERVDQFESPSATDEDLLRVHSPAHVEGVREAWLRARPDSETGRGEGSGGGIQSLDPDTKVSAHSWQAALGSAGGAIEAVRKVASGELANAFVATRPPGHHATPSHPMGFCLFNNVAVAARALQADGLAERILIVDWDVHHGNGTQDVFYSDPSVYFMSLHQSPFYPGTGAAHERGAGEGEGTTLNVPLPAGLSRSEWAGHFESALDRARAEFDPNFVLISAGFDALAQDPLGGMLLEPEDFHGFTRQVMDVADEACSGRVVAVLEGGYHPKRTALAAVAVIRALAGVELDATPTPFAVG